MAKNKKGKFKSGTWILRELSMSRAYLSLGGFAPQLLTLFLLKRNIDKNHNCLNANSITMTYAELENIHNQGNQKKNLPKDGITRTRIIRAIEELMVRIPVKVGHPFRFKLGHLFRSKVGHPSERSDAGVFL
jgi:hypothetical protein